MLKRPFLLLTAILVALVVGWTALWYWSASALEGALLAWQAQQRERGISVEYSGPEIAGFPVGLTAHFADPSAASARGWRWTGPEVAGAAKVWAPLTIESVFAGRHDVAVTPRPGTPELQFSAEAAEAQATTSLLSDGSLEQAQFRLSGLAVTPPTGGLATAELVTGQYGPSLADASGAPLRTELRAQAEKVTLPDRVRVPLGQDVERAGLDAVVVGALPSGPPDQALAQWRDAGGEVEVRRLELIWGPMTLEAEGDASLDSQFRPIGAFTARVHGLIETIDALARDGVIPQGQALAIRIAILALGGNAGSAGGGTESSGPDLEVPITLQNGRLFLGPVPLFPLSPVL